MLCSVTYLAGAGNIFTVLECGAIELEQVQRFARHLCSAPFLPAGTTDGIIVVERGEHDEAALCVHFFNPDGSSGMMCGNGARCAVRFACDRGMVTAPQLVITMAGTRYRASIEGELITVEFPPPRTLVPEMTLELNGHRLRCAYVDVGSDHVVLWSLPAEVDFTQLARAIRWHRAFPRGTNVNFYRLRDGYLVLETYERGVERITGSCGTGALATAVVAWMRGDVTPPTVRVLPPSGEVLEVDIHVDGGVVQSLVLRGRTQLLGTAAVELPDDAA